MVDVVIPHGLTKHRLRYGNPADPQTYTLWRDDVKGLWQPSVIEIQLAFEIVAAVLRQEGAKK